MARKTRRQKQRAATRQGAPPRPAAQQWIPGPAADATADVSDDQAGDDVLVQTSDDPPDEPVAVSASAAKPTASASAAPGRRRIERLSQAAPVQARGARPGRGPANAAAMLQPLDSEDAAIPFDHVPYVPADLRRVLVMALCMVVLIIIAAVVVTRVVH